MKLKISTITDRFDILLEKRLNGAVEQEYAGLYREILCGLTE